MKDSFDLARELQEMPVQLEVKEAEQAEAVKVEAVLTEDQLLAIKLHQWTCDDYLVGRDCGWLYADDGDPNAWVNSFIRKQYVDRVERIRKLFPDMKEWELKLFIEIIND
jgi:hypothetical protein